MSEEHKLEINKVYLDRSRRVRYLVVGNSHFNYYLGRVITIRILNDPDEILQSKLSPIYDDNTDAYNEYYSIPMEVLVAMGIIPEV